jgi:DNA-binding NtrC family response regulator
MRAILIVDDEPRISAVIRDFFENNRSIRVQCAHTGPEAARMLTQEHYDLGVIGLPLRGSSGLDLAALAVNEHTPVLLMTGHPVLRLTMQQFAFPYLGKPFTLHALRIAAAQVMSDPARQLARLKASLESLQANRDALAKAMAESDRLLDVIRARQQLGRWTSAVAKTKEALSVEDARDG